MVPATLVVSAGCIVAFELALMAKAFDYRSFLRILARPVPVNYLLGELGSRLLSLGFPIVLIGTFIETGTGMIHAFNERLASGLLSLGGSMPSWARPAIALGLLVSALLMSRWGIIDLIAVGYGAMTWVFIVVLAIPLLTIGAWKVFVVPRMRSDMIP